MTVFELPPKESCRRRVNFELRYGICVLFPSTNALMTFPNTDKDKLIFVASFKRMPVACVLL